jgi:hypothetical protein
MCSMAQATFSSTQPPLTCNRLITGQQVPIISASVTSVFFPEKCCQFFDQKIWKNLENCVFCSVNLTNFEIFSKKIMSQIFFKNPRSGHDQTATFQNIIVLPIT